MEEPVAVLGAGIVGICCALSLAQRGVPVRLIDRGKPGQEASYGNAGVISPWSFIPMAVPGIWKKVPGMLVSPDRPLSVRSNFWPKMMPWGVQFLKNANASKVRLTADALQSLCQPSIEIFRQHLQGSGHENLIRDSFYIHAFRNVNKASLDAIDYRIRQEKGAELELITEKQLRKLEPALAEHFRAAVVIKGQGRAVSPGALSKVLANKAHSLGVEIVRLEITGLRQNTSGWKLLGLESNLNASRLILAAGAWSTKLLKPLGVNLPLVAERGYHIEFADPQIVVNNSIMDVDTKLVASSMKGGLRLAGASEFANPDDPPDQQRQKLLIRQANTMFPDLALNKPTFWMGRRPSFPDNLPVLGTIEGYPGLFAAFGHSHFGLMTAPKTGEILADLLTDTKPNIDASVFSCKRFKQ